MDQANEIEIIRHGRQLAANCVQGQKESVIGHGYENAAEGSRDYNRLSANGNNPLNSLSQSRGASQDTLPLHAIPKTKPGRLLRRIDTPRGGSVRSVSAPL
jgi:hypothetical protein